MTVDQALTKRFLERAEAKGLVDVAVATMDSPIGTLLLMATPKGLVRIAFETENRDEVLGEVAERVSPRILDAPRRLDPVRRELDRYFDGKLRDFDVALDWSLAGTFARRVLRRTRVFHTARWRATVRSPWASARHAATARWGMRLDPIRSRSWCRATGWFARAAHSAAMGAACPASGGCSTSKPAETVTSREGARTC